MPPASAISPRHGPLCDYIAMYTRVSLLHNTQSVTKRCRTLSGHNVVECVRVSKSIIEEPGQVRLTLPEREKKTQGPGPLIESTFSKTP